MSGNRGKPQAKKENDSAGGSGLLSTLVVAGGAAAIGFMASDLWSKWKDLQSQAPPCYTNSSPCSSSRPHQSDLPRQPSQEEQEKMKKKMKARKECRTAAEDVPEAVQCIVCLDNPREMILEPCGHVSLCMDCAEKVNYCPVCRGQINKKKLVYLS